LDVLKGIFVPKPGEAPGLFQASATIITISTIYLYFAGYVYCYFYYFGFFQVPMETLDASPQFYWIRAFTALDNPFGITLVCLVILTILGYLHQRIPTWVTVIVMIGAFPVLYQISRSEAMSNARWTVCRPPNAVRIHFKEDNAKSSDAQGKSVHAGVKPDDSGHSPAQEPQPKTPNGSGVDAKKLDINEILGLAPDISDPHELVALGENNELFLLLETKDRIVLVREPGCDGSNPPRLTKAAHVYTLPRASVDLTNLSLQ
jgi:hypothetical protein